MDCIFCKIIKKEIPAEIVFEDQEILAFKDIRPKAPVHLLIIPKHHIPTINDVAINQANLVGQMIVVAKQLAAEHKIAESGYRLVFNCNQNAGQEVFHIHLHLFGGRLLTWPPG